MSRNTAKPSSENQNNQNQSVSSRYITQLLCFAIVASAAVIGFVQARKALYEFDRNSSIERREKYSGNDVSQPDEITSYDGRSIFDFSYTSSTTSSASRNPATTTTGLPSRTSKTARESAPGKTTASTTAALTDGDRVEITVSPVNIRAGAGRGSAVLGRTSRGKVYRLLSTKIDSANDMWCEIELEGGKTGWILGSCCRIVDEADSSSTSKRNETTTTATHETTAKKTTASTTAALTDGERVEITVSPVNIRAGAGRGFTVLGRTSRGKVYRLISTKNDSDNAQWCEIEYEKGKTGWILGSCCRIVSGGESKAAEKTSTTTAKKTTTTTTVRKTTTTTVKKTTTTTTASITTTTTTVKKTTTTKSKKTTTTTTARKIEGARVEITVSPVNIRAGAGRGFAVLARTSKGKVFRLISTKKDSQNNEWCEIEYENGKSGWILGSCCRSVGDRKTETSTTTEKTTTTKSKTTTTTANRDSLIMKVQPNDHSAKYFIVVYKGSQSVVVYGKDSNGDYTKQAKVFTCSTGRKSSPTRIGKYHIRAKYRWRELVGGVYGQYSSSISGDYLFHSVPYYRRDASTLEDEEYDKLGTPASKGCIRMCVRDCKWIYDNCSIGTQVIIINESGPSGPGVPSRRSGSEYSGWDPSDKWASDNPYFD